MTSIFLPGASGSCFVKSVFTCGACVAVANPKVKINTERMSFFMSYLASVLSVMCCDNRKVRLRQTANGRANCRFRGIFVEQFNSIARCKISHCTPLSLRSSIARTRDVKLTLYKKCNTQSFPVVCDSPSPGTSWRNRENPAPLRAHVSATIGTETVVTLVKVPRKEYCFRQNGFIGEIQCSRPKLVNGSENRCSFIFDKKYDELRWFRLTRVTAYGMNVFRRFVKYLPGTKPLKRASAN